MHRMYTLDDLAAKNKKVLVRVDLNMPMQDGLILDDDRMNRIVPTLLELCRQQAKVIICSHLGRPKGKDLSLSMQGIAEHLSQKTGVPVVFIADLDNAGKIIEDLPAGHIAFLENLRFHPGEESNDTTFAQHLAALADVYVNEAFSVSHRAHASVEAVAHLLPSYAGRQMQAEIKALSLAFDHPQEPIIAIVGGSKVSTKLSILKSLAQKVMYLVPAGGLANTFALAHDISVGRSICEPDMLDMVMEIEEVALNSGCAILSPSDVVVTDALSPDGKHRICLPSEVHYKEMIVDFGPQTVHDIFKISQLCRTLIWNGPLGVFEVPPFEQGSVELARKIANLTERHGLFSVAGGGETNAVIHQANVHDKFSYMSTAGGAFLEWIEGKKLPGVEALKRESVNVKKKDGKVSYGI